MQAASGLVTSGLVAHYPFGAADGDRKRNLLRYSEAFDNAAWGRNTDVGIDVDAAIAPNGTLTADKIVEANLTQQHFISQTVASTITDNANGAYGIYAKADERNVIQVTLKLKDGATFRNAKFNVSTGTVVSSSAGVTATISADRNGFYHCVVVTSVLAGASSIIAYLQPCLNDGTVSYAGDPTKGIIVWGAQLNEGTVPLQYEMTTANQILYDRSPFANHGQLGSTAGSDVNDGSWTNQGLTLITDDYITLPQDVSSRLGGASGATVEMVFKRNAAGVSHSFLGLSINGTDSKVAVNFNADDTITVGGRSRAADAFQSKTTSAAYADTASYHYLASWVDVANNAIGIDYDGIEVALAAGAVAFGQTTFAADVGTRQVLGANAGLANFVNASISHGMVRGRVLSAAERARNRSVLRGIMARRGIALA